MKKVYEKPAMLVENFELTQTIADNCGAKPGGGSLGKPLHGGKHNCGWKMGKTILWSSPDTGCNKILPVDADVQGVCYNNPYGGYSIFGS